MDAIVWIGKGTVIFPGTYIDNGVTIGKDCFIGTGAKIVNRTEIGNRVWIQEDTVISTDGLTTDWDENGHSVEILQFDLVLIEDDITIGANSVVSRGAIDGTLLHKGRKADRMTFVFPNVHIGRESFIAGQTFLFGSAAIGKLTQVSSGYVVGNYVKIGDLTLPGMDSAAPRTDLPEKSGFFPRYLA